MHHITHDHQPILITNVHKPGLNLLHQSLSNELNKGKGMNNS